MSFEEIRRNSGNGSRRSRTTSDTRRSSRRSNCDMEPYIMTSPNTRR